jgi:hypothetical protein
MCTPVWKRALALLLGCWLAMVMVEPPVLHACPMHGPKAGGAHGAAVADASPAAHAAHGDAPERGAPGGGHQCSCLGDCGSAGVQGALLPATHPARWAPAAVVRPAPVPSAIVVALPQGDHVLPFANGPPHRA